MLLLIPKPPQNINKGMPGICCKDSGVDDFGVCWICPQSEGICGHTSHFYNSGGKHEVPGMQNISYSQNISFSFKKESWFGGLIWILRRKERKEKEGIAWGWSKYFILIFWKPVLRSFWNENVIMKWGAENASVKIEAEHFKMSECLFFFPIEAMYDILTWRPVTNFD